MGRFKIQSKQFVVAKIVQRMRLKGKGSEIFQNLMAMKTTRKYDDIKPEKPTSTLKRAPLQLVVLMLVVNLYLIQQKIS